MKEYLDLLQHVLDHGNVREDRTGVGTVGVFGYQLRVPVSYGAFPLLTTKKVHFKSILVELLWFLSGSTNIRFLKENGVSIWDEWADKDGDLGPVYGDQWRFWANPRAAIISPKPDFLADHRLNEADKFQVTHGTIDQIRDLIHALKTNPFSRRHIVSAWNPADVPFMKLPPCHTLWQCYVEEHSWHESEEDKGTWKTLSIHLYARSIDSFLGLPFNIASYALLLLMLAQVTGMEPGDLVISFGDLHIYLNHLDQVKEQLSREPLQLPRVELDPTVKDINDFNLGSVTLLDYEHHPAIKAPIAI